MKLIKSLLLGSAAGLAAVAGAQAADLPVKKAAAVEYVRVCSAYGAGFFYIPGTETCLSIGGRVRADYLFGEPVIRSEDAIGFRARGRLQADARTQTAYGTLRALVRFEITRSSGTAFGREGGIVTDTDLAQAFIQFGGLTAGRVTSFFSNGDLPTDHMGTLRFDDAPDVDLLAYTFSFGDGFSATLSIEDGLDRRRGLLNPGFGAVIGGDVPYAGQRLPDVVGNIKYTATWGTAQLSGAVHQIRSVVLGTGPTAGNAVGAFLPGLVGTIPDNEYGFAIAGYLGVNLPMLGAGDALWLAATYADGAPAYLDGGNSGTIITPFAAFQGFGGGLADATIDPFTGDLDKTRAWSIAGGLRHYWTPQIRSNLFASYLDSDSRSPFTTFSDFREIRVGANVFWQPVSGLDIGVEVIYANVDQRAAAVGLFNDDENGWEGRLRIQRDF
jgi:hypothetical protein